VNDRYGFSGSGTDGPTATQKVDLLIGVDATLEMQRQVQIQQAGVGTGLAYRALLGLRQRAGLIRGEASGATDGAVKPGEFAVEYLLGARVVGDFFIGQQGKETVLEGAEAAFDFAFGLRTGSHEVRDAQRGESSLELRMWVESIGAGLVAK